MRKISRRMENLSGMMPFARFAKRGTAMDKAIDWDAYCSLHKADDGGGLLDAAKIIRRGSLAELVRFVMLLPEKERSEYVIEKAGDHRLGFGEIAALARRDDLPSS